MKTAHSFIDAVIRIAKQQGYEVNINRKRLRQIDFGHKQLHEEQSNGVIVAVAKIFDRDDKAYQQWLVENPTGFVLNVRRNLTPSYMVLHSVRCDSIRNYGGMTKWGGFTERSYLKVCAPTVSELRSWVKENGRPSGTFSKECGLCKCRRINNNTIVY